MTHPSREEISESFCCSMKRRLFHSGASLAIGILHEVVQTNAATISVVEFMNNTKEMSLVPICLHFSLFAFRCNLQPVKLNAKDVL